MVTVSLENTIIVPAEGPLYKAFMLPPKTVLETIAYAIDISRRLNDGDSLTSAVFQSNDNTIVISNVQCNSDTGVVTFYVGAGMPNQISVIWGLLKTTAGEIRQITMTTKNITPIETDITNETPMPSYLMNTNQGE